MVDMAALRAEESVSDCCVPLIQEGRNASAPVGIIGSTVVRRMGGKILARVAERGVLGFLGFLGFRGKEWLWQCLIV